VFSFVFTYVKVNSWFVYDDSIAQFEEA